MISNAISRLRASKYITNVGWLIRGNVLAQLIQLAALPILSRLYTPEEFGFFALFTALIGLLSVTLTLRFESAILIADDADIEMLVSLATRCVYAVTILSPGLFACLVWNKILGYGVLPTWPIALLPVALLGVGFFNIGRATCLREGNAALLARSRIDRSAGNAIVKISTGLVSSGSFGLMLGEVVGAWMAIPKVVSSLLLRSILMRQRIRHRIGVTWQRFRKFPLLELPSSILNQAALTLPVPMIAAIGGPEIVGAYAIARMVVVAPNAQIGRAVGDAFQLRVSKIIREGDFSQLLPTIGKTSLGLAGLGIVPFGAFILFSPWAFPFLLGDDWTAAGDFAALLAIWMYLAFVVSPVSRILSVLQRQEFKLIYDSFIFTAICVLYWNSVESDRPPQEFIKSLVGLNVIGYLLYLLVIMIVVKKAVTANRISRQGGSDFVRRH